MTEPGKIFNLEQLVRKEMTQFASLPEVGVDNEALYLASQPTCKQFVSFYSSMISVFESGAASDVDKTSDDANASSLLFSTISWCYDSVLSAVFYQAFAYVRKVTDKRLESLKLAGDLPLSTVVTKNANAREDLQWLNRGLRFVSRIFDDIITQTRAGKSDSLMLMCLKTILTKRKTVQVMTFPGDCVSPLYDIVYDAYSGILYPHDGWSDRAVVYSSLYMLPDLSVFVLHIVQSTIAARRQETESMSQADVEEDPILYEELLMDFHLNLRRLTNSVQSILDKASSTE